MKTRVTSLLALTLLSAALLSGCALIPSGPKMIDADDIADTAEDALQDEFDSRYKVDCDDDDEVRLQEDVELDCTATNRDTDAEYDANIVITDVNGTRYKIEVGLADDANNADDETSDDSDDTDSDNTDSSGATVPGTDFADVVVDALDEVLGYAPTDMECLSDDVEIVEGTVEYCFFSDEDGEERTVEATITSFDESSSAYEIDAEVVG